MKKNKRQSDQLELFPIPKFSPSGINAVTDLDLSEEERRTFLFYVHKFLDIEGDGHYHYLWHGSINAKGCPTYYHRTLKKVFSARRIMHIIAFGRIPRDTEVFTTCNFPSCVGPNCLDVRKRSRHNNLMQFKERVHG